MTPFETIVVRTLDEGWNVPFSCAGMGDVHRLSLLRAEITVQLRENVVRIIVPNVDLDVTLVRIAIVALSFLGGAGVPLYFAAWLLIPEEGSDVAIAADILNHARYH